MLAASPPEGRSERADGWRVAGSSRIPPSITGEPIIKDKLQYTSLGYANFKLDASHQKIGIAIFCIDKLETSPFSAGSDTYKRWNKKQNIKPQTGQHEACALASLSRKNRNTIREVLVERRKKNIVGGNEKALRRWQLASADTVFTKFPKTPHITFDLRWDGVKIHHPRSVSHTVRHLFLISWS